MSLFNISILYYNAERKSNYQCDFISRSFLVCGHIMKAVTATQKKAVSNAEGR